MKTSNILLVLGFCVFSINASAADELCQDTCLDGDLIIQKFQSWGCGHGECKYSGCRKTEVKKGACPTGEREFPARGEAYTGYPNPYNLAVEDMWLSARNQCGPGRMPFQIKREEVMETGMLIAVRATFQCDHVSARTSEGYCGPKQFEWDRPSCEKHSSRNTCERSGRCRWSEL